MKPKTIQEILTKFGIYYLMDDGSWRMRHNGVDKHGKPWTRRKVKDEKKIALAVRLKTAFDAGCLADEETAIQTERSRQCRKMGQAHTGKNLSKEHKKALSNAQTGRKHSPETKAKISAANTVAIITRKRNYRAVLLCSVKEQGFHRYMPCRGVQEEAMARILLIQVERGAIIDFDYEVVEIPYHDESGFVRMAVPDFKVMMADGSTKIIEVGVSIKTMRERKPLRTKAVEDYCQAQGWELVYYTRPKINQHLADLLLDPVYDSLTESPLVVLSR